ncbi:MAG: PAS domain-containing protein [Ginsengibacter sp.]
MIRTESLLQIFNLSSVSTVILLPDSPKFAISEGNHSFLRVTNSSSNEEIQGKDICEFFSENQYFENGVTGLSATLEKVMETKEVQKIFIEGEYFELAPLFSARNEIQFIVLYYYRNLNNFNCGGKNYLKESGALKMSAGIYEKQFHHSPMAKWLCELDTLKILDVNDSALHEYGYSREEFLSLTLAELGLKDEISKLSKTHELIVDKNGLIHFGIITHLKKDKTQIKMDISGSRFSFQGKTCMMMVCVDVAEKENALVQLRDIQERLMNAQRLAKIGYWRRDIQNGLVFWSDEVYNMLGLDKQTTEANYDLFYERLVPEDQEAFSKARAMTLAGKALLDIEFRISVANGSTIWAHGKAKLIKDDAGNPTIFEGTFQDITEEKLLKLSLAESNQRFDYVTRATSDVIWDLDLIKGKSYWGEGFVRAFGYNLSEIKSDPGFRNSHIHPDDLEPVKGLIQKSIVGDATNWTSEYRFQKANGEYAFVIDKCIIIRDKNGKATRLVGAMQDITEKKTLQQLLDKANRLAKIGSWEIDVVDSTVYWSDITKEIRETSLDYQPSLEDGIGYFKEGYSRDTIKARVKDSMENGTSWQEELQIYTHTGKLKWVRTTGKAELKEGKCVKIYGSFQDIDQSKKAELAIKNLFEEKNEILDSIGDGFFTIDKNWIVTYWNKEAERMLGTPKSKVLGKNIWNVFPSRANFHSYKKYNEAFQTGARVFFEDYYEAMDRWFEISVYPSKRGLSVYFKDISDRISAQMELNKLNHDLQKTAKDLAISNSELEQYAYIASHDLQEPLRMISSFLTQLERKYNDILDEKGRQYIYFAVDGAKRMRQIILDLLEFSRLGRFEEKKEKVDLNEVVEDVISLYKKRIEETCTVIQFDKLPTVNGYKSPLRQVIQNLVSNAIKYRSKDESPLIVVEAEDLNFQWKFSVKDNGIGIEPEYYERIFNIFQRLHRNEEYSGSGIGLAIVKKIVIAMGGEIGIEPNGDKGSIFIFTIPK